MIEIKRNSIWYKLANYHIFNWTPWWFQPQDLCGLGRRIIFNTVINIGVPVGLILLIYTCWTDLAVLIGLLDVLLPIVVAILIFALLIAICVYVNSDNESRPIIFEYIKAKKEKVCPLIKWKD